MLRRLLTHEDRSSPSAESLSSLDCSSSMPDNAVELKLPYVYFEMANGVLGTITLVDLHFRSVVAT